MNEVMKMNKLNIIHTLNNAWIIADSTAILNIDGDDVMVTMPVWADSAAIMIDGTEYRVQMEVDDANSEIYTLGAWDLPRLNALLAKESV